MEQDLDLFVLWKKVIPKNWKMLVILPLLAGLIGFLISIYLITPLYTASATITIMLPPEKQAIYQQDLQASRMLAETYCTIALSQNIIEAAADVIFFHNGADDNDTIISILKDKDPKIITLIATDLVSTDESETIMSVERVRDTEIIRLKVTDPEPLMSRDLANAWAATFKDAIIEIMEVENVNIINKAVLPEKPVSPQVFLNTLAAMLFGLVGAFGLAFMLEFLDQQIKDPTEAQQLFDIPVIGIIPVTPARAEKANLFDQSNLHKATAEALRTIWTNIQYSSVDRPIKQILLAGINPKCDQSSVVVNLGATIASFGNSVLLVDSDFRWPNQHNYFKVNNNTGLSNLIFEVNPKLESDLAFLISKNNLTLLPSGPIPLYPTEVLASDQMKDLSASFAEKYDFVVYNAPPLLTFPDASVLSKLTDATIVVIDYGKVSQSEAKEAIDKLNIIKTNIIGIIINNIPRNKSYNTGYYYYYDNNTDTKRHRKQMNK